MARAVCEGCGDVYVAIDRITVRVCEDTAQGSYHFRCPQCRMVVARRAAWSILAQLMFHDEVRVESWRMPAELAEPHTGLPLCEEDVAAFVAALNREPAA